MSMEKKAEDMDRDEKSAEDKEAEEKKKAKDKEEDDKKSEAMDSAIQVYRHANEES